MKSEKKICPICKREIVGYPAISRRDNETEICSECGTNEAVEDFLKFAMMMSGTKQKEDE